VKEPVEAAFAERCAQLPRLGIGISTEYGAGRSGLDVLALRRAHPEHAQFLEIGIDLERGVDADARAWVEAGWPVTYHFLDANLEESESLDELWMHDVRVTAHALGAAWLCGDAGLWHIGPRDRGHGVLMPPILSAESADEMARGVVRLRRASGLEVLPENPPAHVYLGDLHLLDYFARVAEAADCGLLLDVAHLAIYQRFAGCAPLEGLDRYPLERVVEVHVAGASEFVHAGKRFIDDNHSPEPLPETWLLLEHVLARAPALRAIVYECERNRIEDVLPRFARLAELADRTGWR
jgi:uncharacterized protein (UPF0276 family)